MKIILPLALLCLLAGCHGSPPEADNEIAPGGKNDRFEVTSAQHFSDGNDYRFIIVLRDKQTGREFLAVTGAGVLEMKCTYDSATKTEHCEEK